MFWGLEVKVQERGVVKDANRQENSGGIKQCEGRDNERGNIV